jgi:nitric oxide reductase NorD protein
VTPAGTASAFSPIERRLGCYLRALWGRPITLRDADAPRASIVEGSVRLPRQFPAGAGDGGIALYRAAATHAAAHLANSTRRFPLAKLRPIQVALVSLIEDARVESLAWRDMPGLRRLWLPGWIKRMKRTIRTLGWRFNADRMVMDYTLKCYVPAAGGTSSDISGMS